MVSWFKPRLVDREVAEWQLEGFQWVLENHGAQHQQDESVFWKPVGLKQPEQKGGAEAAASHLFHEVCRHIRYNPDKVELVPAQVHKQVEVNEYLLTKTVGKSAAGTWQVVQDETGHLITRIKYDLDLVSDYDRLAATFAHELCHSIAPPGTLPVDVELEELFTDLIATCFGFSLVMANGRFTWNQYGDETRSEWGYRSLGYLPQADLVFASALFSQIYQVSPEWVAAHLIPKLRKDLAKAYKQLEQYSEEVTRLTKLATNQDAED